MTHQTSSPETHATPTSPNESSCTAKVPNCSSGGQAQAPPAPNADLQMTENRVADSQDVEDISCKNTCDDSSSREIVNQTLDSPREPTPEDSNNCKESSNEKETAGQPPHQLTGQCPLPRPAFQRARPHALSNLFSHSQLRVTQYKVN